MTTESTPATWEKITRSLRALTEQPFVLLCFLLAANALARPYANFIDDARLYGAQVLNRAGNGAYQDDLFFRYGSQDQFSIFSALLAPLVNTLGLDTAFFLVYLAGTATLIAGLVRLVPRFVEDRLIAFLALLYLVVTPLNFGGLYCLQVHEPFLTPRLLAVGLVLWGLDFLLSGRYFVSLIFMVLGAMMHPLIAVGGVFTWTGVFLLDKLGWRNCLFVGLGLVAAGIVALIRPPIFLAQLDDTWREDIRSVTPYIFLSEWEARDWVNVVIMGIGLTFGIGFYRSKLDPSAPQQVRFLVVLAVLGVAALVATGLGSFLPYALLVQGQAYRCMWLLKVLQVPLCFVLADRLWRSEIVWKRACALVLAGYFVSTGPPLMEWSHPLIFLPFLLFFRGVMDRPRRPGWIVRSIIVSVVLGQLAWMAGWLRLCLMNREKFLTFIDTFEYVHIIVDNFIVLPSMALLIGLLLLLQRLGLQRRSLAAACLAIGAAAQLVFFVVPNTEYVRANGTCYMPDVDFAHTFLSSQRTSNKPITVYSVYGKVEYVWLDMCASCYFDMAQTSGFIFNRQTTMEGKRRALLVEPFEMAHHREFQTCLSARDQFIFGRLFKHGLDAPEPTYDDLVRLAWDKDEQGNFILDYAVLKHEFPGCAASNGRVFVYDCREVRMQTRYHPARP